MTRKRILVYIEGEGGGGTTSKRKFNDGEFRNSWRLFLQPLVEFAKGKGVVFFTCIPGRGGTTTAETFAKPLPQHEGALRILLIDSEKPVNDVGNPWVELEIQPPTWANNGNCYLMVQCLETWLLADVESLKGYYKNCFNEKKIKAWPNLETTPRKTIQSALEEATSGCHRAYSHAEGNLLIAIVQRDKLKTLSSVDRLFRGLEEKIEEYATT